MSADTSSAATAGLVYLGVAGQVLNTITLVTAPVTTAGFNKLEQVITIPQGVAQVRVKLVGFAPTDTATAGTVTFDEVGLFENDGSLAIGFTLDQNTMKGALAEALSLEKILADPRVRTGYHHRNSVVLFAS